MEVTKIDGRIRFCAFETYDGLRRHYICGHHEYCCALGCCVSTAFSFYQLWYFWLLLLLIILICSGGGWWFRWRHGAFSSTRTPTPVHTRRHPRLSRAHGPRAPRVYPHSHYYSSGSGYDNYSLPPGYDKDPPSYNEVITHLNQFPPASVSRPDTELSNYGAAASTSSAIPKQCDDPLLSMPPPSYEMVLDLKRKEIQLETEIADEERRERVRTTRGRIENIFGRTKRKKQQNENSPPSAASFPVSSPSSLSSGLFTISSESLPSADYYAQASTSNGQSHTSVPSRHVTSPSDSESSHSDYSSNFLSTPTSSRSPSVSSADSPLNNLTVPPLVDVSSTEGGSPGELLSVNRGLASRPCTGRSVLSRPTTSISTRSLPPPPQLQRKTSLPGALLESEDEDKEDK
ncbi:uncharacterized protein LOC122263773 isoform X2 [Penaeus japonicus]|uniref:uncharacterized protein LOC122263773 isoform X2 n=1 Tax=Penaeus japonicus TaxID=27405 RepID=UPI001C714733|nr:uncharacterized protein LOC122263773 isoform X2 [Penaeus japonicus]